MAKEPHKSVLFLCTGNYYRSRFAEVLFNSTAQMMGLGWRATSKGLALETGINNIGPIAVSAVRALEALGVRDVVAVNRFPASATVADFENADFVVALKREEHLPLLQERFPAWVEKVEFWQVDDAPPALQLIEREVMNLAARLISGGKRQELSADESGTEQAQSKPTASAKKKAALVRVGRETKGRRGKGVTIVSDVPLNDAGLHELAAKLKQRCGTGGTVKDGRIEIQGDQRERLTAELEKMGYQVKRVGG
jgi:predicted translation initiation factor SUI1